jgi:Phasin protein
MRRSMAELAASLKSEASDNSPLELPPPTQRSLAASLEAGVNINSSLDYANALAEASVPLSVSSKAADQPREQQVESEMPQQGRPAEQEYRAKAFELMTANVKANLDYANKLRKLRTPLEFIELSTTHARKQFELIMLQTAALGALSRSLAKASAERMSAGVERVFGRDQLKT